MKGNTLFHERALHEIRLYETFPHGVIWFCSNITRIFPFSLGVTSKCENGKNEYLNENINIHSLLGLDRFVWSSV